MKNGGGHFAPKLGGQFELESGGHFKLELGGQYHWNLQTYKSKYSLITFSLSTLSLRLKLSVSIQRSSDMYLPVLIVMDFCLKRILM